MRYIVAINGQIKAAGINRRQAIMVLENHRCDLLSSGIGVTIRGRDFDLFLIDASGGTGEVRAQ